MENTAAPGREDRRTLRSAFPIVVPNPLSSGEISDAVLLSDGHILIAHQHGIKEIDKNKKVVWSMDAPKGYEIHSGVNTFGENARFWMRLEEDNAAIDSACNTAGNVLGTYLHGLFDDGQLAEALVKRARQLKGLPEDNLTAEQAAVNMKAYREAQFDILAKTVRESLDMDKVYAILRGSKY